MQNFRNLDVWRKAFDFCSDIYATTSKFPYEEKFGITNQIRRAASSIGANIAEGCGRQSQKEFLQFLFNAFGSVKECEHFLLLSKRLSYVEDSEILPLLLKVEEISKMLNGLIGTIKLKREGKLITQS